VTPIRKAFTVLLLLGETTLYLIKPLPQTTPFVTFFPLPSPHAMA